MVMEGAPPRSSSLAALLFLTLVLVAAGASGASCGSSVGGDDNVAAAAVEEEKQQQCHPRADELFMLAAFHYKDGGEEIRVLSDQRSDLLSGLTGFANRSGHWFYSPVRARREEGRRRRRRLFLLPQPQPNSSNNRVGAEGLWDTLSVLLNSTAADDDEDDGEQEAGYMLVAMETSGGDKKRFVVLADQRYFSINGFAEGFISTRRWFFRDSDPHCLLPLAGGGSHAEVVASSVVTVDERRQVMPSREQ